MLNLPNYRIISLTLNLELCFSFFAPAEDQMDQNREEKKNLRYHWNYSSISVFLVLSCHGKDGENDGGRERTIEKTNHSRNTSMEVKIRGRPRQKNGREQMRTPRSPKRLRWVRTFVDFLGWWYLYSPIRSAKDLPKRRVWTMMWSPNVPLTAAMTNRIWVVSVAQVKWV